MFTGGARDAKLRAFATALGVLALSAGMSGCETEPPPIDALRDYALNYAPCEPDGVECVGLQETPPEVASVLALRPQDEEYRLYVTLVLLKLSRAQYENYRVNWEIRKVHGLAGLLEFWVSEDPLLLAFSSFSGVSLGGEFVQTSIVDDWLTKQPALIEHPLIRAEMERLAAWARRVELERRERRWRCIIRRPKSMTDGAARRPSAVMSWLILCR